MTFQPSKPNFVAKPKCICGRQLAPFFQFDELISCNICLRPFPRWDSTLFHCPSGRNYHHPNGYYECRECGACRHRQSQSNYNSYQYSQLSQRLKVYSNHSNHSNHNHSNHLNHSNQSIHPGHDFSLKYKNESTFLPLSPINGPQKQRNLKHMQASSSNQFSWDDLNDNNFSLNHKAKSETKKRKRFKKVASHASDIVGGIETLISMASIALIGVVGFGAVKAWKYFRNKKKKKSEQQKALQQALKVLRFTEDDMRNPYIFNEANIRKRHQQLIETAKKKPYVLKISNHSEFTALRNHYQDADWDFEALY
eukprot:531435_1